MGKTIIIIIFAILIFVGIVISSTNGDEKDGMES